MTTNKRILIVAALIAVCVACYLIWRRRQAKKAIPTPLTPPVPVIPSAPPVPGPLTAYADDYDLPPELQGMSSDQIDAMMHERYQKPLEYRDTRELLAEPNADPLLFDKDVRNPLTFNNTRTVTGPWKQRNQDEGDFIRGDLPIAPRGGAYEDKWFVSKYGPANIKQGALTQYFNMDSYGTEAIATEDYPIYDI